MKFAQILSRVTGSPWFITPESLASITALLEARLRDGARFDPIYPAADPESPDEPAAPYAVRSAGGNVAVINCSGILGQHLGLMEQMCGGCDYASVLSSIKAALADPAISSVVLWVDSRGGTAAGCAETFAAIREARAAAPAKQLVAFSDSICCSAGYYIAAACDAFFCTLSATTGCIGTLLMVEDHTEANAKEGIKRFAIKSASMKDIGNPNRPMTPEELKFLQGQIDYLGGLFQRDMKSARPQIAAEVFEKGLSYYGEQAQQLGLVDGIVPGIDALVSSLSAVRALPAV